MQEEGFWQGKQVFVTGCTGLLGSWLTAVLQQQGANVIGLVHKRPSPLQIPGADPAADLHTIQGDIGDFDLLSRILTDHQIDTVFHLAAQTLVVVANRDPLPTFETNIRGTWVLLEAIRQYGRVERVVVAGSDKAYGSQQELPYKEDAPLHGEHPYDVSKSCADLITQSYAHTYNVPAAVIRSANLYGGGDLNWKRLIPGAIRSVLQGERPVVRSDGSMKRDFIYVKDVVRGFLRVAQNLQRPDVQGEAFNLGIDNPTDVLTVINTIIRLSGVAHLEPIILNEARHEIQDQYLCSEKAQRVLDWQPHYSLPEGLEQTMAWYRDYLAVETPAS